MLIQTHPKSSLLAMRMARPWSRVHTDDARANSTPFAQRHGLVLVVESLNRDDGTEDLFLDDPIVLANVGHDGRLIEESALADAMTTRQHRSVVGQ